MSGEWRLVETPASLVTFFDSSERVIYTQLSIDLKMQRRSFFFMTNLMFPRVLLDILCLLSFCLPPDAHVRSVLSLLLFLALLYVHFLVSFVLPPTSFTIPLIVRYNLFSMIMMAISVLVAILVWNVHHCHGAMPNSIKRLFLGKLSKGLCVRRGKGSGSDGDEGAKEDTQVGSTSS